MEKTQSARGDNQNRPTSSGGYAAGGPVGGSNASNTSGQFPGGDGDGNALLSPELDAASTFGYGGGSGHNGIGGAGY